MDLQRVLPIYTSSFVDRLRDSSKYSKSKQDIHIHMSIDSSDLPPNQVALHRPSIRIKNIFLVNNSTNYYPEIILI